MERRKTGQFNWVDLSARDFDRQSAFYEGLFGWGHNDVPFGEGMVYRMFTADGHTVGGMSQLAVDMIGSGQASAWNTYVATDDVDRTVARAVELGGEEAVPPMDVMESGRMAAIQDPTGASLFLWKPAQHDATMEYMLPGTLSWADLSTRDPEKAAAFYTALLGWDVQALEGGPTPYWQVLVDGEGEGGIMPMPDAMPADMPAFWLPYFGTTDIQADFAKAVELGATVLREPTEVPGMLWFAVLADPAGATFALLQVLAPGN